MSTTEGQHLGDALSAMLDGELDPDEHRAAVAHLGACSQCQAELDDISRVRDQLRTAPLVDPPFGFYERMLPGKRRWPRWGTVAASVAATAAMWLVIGGFVVSASGHRSTPHVDTLRAAAAGDLTGMSLHRAPPARAKFPDKVADRPRASTFRAAVLGGESGDEANYGTGTTGVLTVFVTHAEVEWSGLQGGLRQPVEGLPGLPWLSVAPGRMPAIVVEQEGETVVVLGNVDISTLEQAARDIGDPVREAFVDHLRRAANDLVDAFRLDR